MSGLVGGNNAQLTKKMKIIFSIIHIFEPVPTFNKILNENWNAHKKTNDWDATIYNFGLGSNDRLI